VPCSTNAIENAMASGEEIPEQIPEQDVDRTFEQVPKQNVDCTGLESGGATIECIKEINDHLPLSDESASIGGPKVPLLLAHMVPSFAQ